MAASQATLRPGPSWDETIVPALRNRKSLPKIDLLLLTSLLSYPGLESESRTLSRRISAISVTSVEEPAPSHNPSTMEPSTRNQTASSSYQFHSSKGTSIPRPSLQQSRVSSENRPELNGSSRVNGDHPSFAKPRSRTYSQPKSFDPSSSRNGNGSGLTNPTTNGSTPVLPTPESSRSTSPLYISRTSDSKPTRIPKVALGRTSSLSSRGHHQPSSIDTVVMSESRNGHGPYSPPTPESTPDLWRLEETTLPRSTVTAANLPHSRLLHEPPPFQSGSASSIDHSHDHSQDDDDTIPAGRRSNDSEERPFEHWYRGEVSRNGGVGELRVGKRMEMLDIANYGHTLRKASPRTNSRVFPPLDDTPRRRRRADSISEIGTRESLYLDEERAEEAARVLDEGPPTDLDRDEDSDYSSSMQQRHFDTLPPPMGHGPSSQMPMKHPTPASIQPTRIPLPAPPRQSSEPPRTRTPTLTQRGASEPPSFPTTPSPPPQPSVPRSASQPQTQTQTQAQKRRGKSPGASTPPASKRSKATAKSIASKKAAEEKNRRSVAYYPAPADGVDMVDAIPSWTQPIPASGNWDEVRSFSDST